MADETYIQDGDTVYKLNMNKTEARAKIFQKALLLLFWLLALGLVVLLPLIFGK
jgi:hypothetical protein